MRFSKMHGIGNDYIYINCFEEKVENPEKVSVYVSDRHKGIGSDGLVLILPSDKADFRMRIFNADGSEAMMCGNATRCIGKYVFDKGMTGKTELTLETNSGIKYLKLFPVNGKVESVEVNMGQAVLLPREIPVNSDKEKFISEPVIIGGTEYKITCVSMGNPHAVVYFDSIDDLNLESVGPLFEYNELFPDRINTEFIKVENSHTLHMRVWEPRQRRNLCLRNGSVRFGSRFGIKRILQQRGRNYCSSQRRRSQYSLERRRKRNYERAGLLLSATGKLI